ncbi:hypothetical protein AD954_10195 [Acetobacter cerevisiae]|uniref:Papain-like cysteine peptidase n=2 Tax=Acetobacter cerevisiae TaxID=178900 RepID=A0A149V9D8_9PROT|nr:hypothetical protein AD954_10195 [Acetobacter cerevisiae]
MKTERFENIGDNCEFGFVKRAHGDESGGLLRWARASPEALIEALRHSFAGLYAFENLSAFWDNMVRDSRYGFCFHTGMLSQDRLWCDSEEQRWKIYKSEKEKIDYLVEKFLQRLSDPSVFCVYKCNENVQHEVAEELAQAIAQHGPARLLVVRHTEDPNLIGHVRPESSYLAGYLDHFAPYGHSDQFSPVWNAVLSEALALPLPIA